MSRTLIKQQVITEVNDRLKQKHLFRFSI